METYVLQNETLHVQIDPRTLQCSVAHRRSGRKWHFQQNADADLRVVHGITATLAYLRDARHKEILRLSTPDDERLTCCLRGLPGGVGLSITFALPHRENVLRIEVEPLPTASVSSLAEVWYPGRLALVDDEEEYTVWPNGAGMMIPAHHDQEIEATMS